MAETQIQVYRSGEWLAGDEFLEQILAAVGRGDDVNIDLEGADHLDASSLQIMLALAAEQRKQGHKLRLTSASAALSEWFNHAGATDYLLQPRSENV